MGVDRGALEESLRRLDRLPAAELDMAALLNQVVLAVSHLFSVTGAGLLVVDTAHELRYLASSDEAAKLLEDAQLQTGEGPCLDAFILDRRIRTGDLQADARWPSLRVVLEGTKVRAVLAVPVRFGSSPVGTLNLYVDHARVWDDEDLDALDAYAKVLENLLAVSVAAHRTGELAGQLQYALDYRATIERAIGFEMASEGVDQITAFNRLRTRARNSRRKIGEVAEETLRRLPPT